MSGNDAGGPKRKFQDLLEAGASVDDIFKDDPAPKGSNPFGLDLKGGREDIQPLSIEAVNPSDAIKQGSNQIQAMGADTPDMSSVLITDNDSLFCINRKYAVVESLFKLINREYYTFGQLISEVLRIAVDHVKSEAGSFLEIDHKNQCMFFRAVMGRSSQNLLNFTVPVGQGIAGFVCETQQPMALSSVDDSSVYLRSISDAVGFETKNLVAYPIIIRGTTFGCIELLNRMGEEQFTDADKEVITTLCEFAAKVIEMRLVMAAMSKELAEFKQSKKKEDAA
jgi:transcriptional regulator with GAF, ATPase, and Fis domain